MTDQERLTEIVEDLAADFRETVQSIETGIQTTQNHYGNYLTLILQIGETKEVRQVVALALLKAGANKQGVADALKNAV